MFRNLPSIRQFDQNRFRNLLEWSLGRRRDQILAWYFAVVSYLVLARHYTELFGVDAAIYYRAAAAYRAGGSAWEAVVVSPGGQQYHFAALPSTVLTFLPFTEMNERAFVWLWLVLSVASAFWIVRCLKLAWWWVMFPPLVEGVYAANPQIVLLALLVTGGSVLAGLAPLFKIYAIVPLVGERRYRSLLIIAAFLGASWLLAPELWTEYIGRFFEIGRRLANEAQGGYSAFGFQGLALLLITGASVALLATVDMRSAGWLAVPALLPAAQFHLSTMALPVLARNAPVALIVAMAFPVRGMSSAAIALYGVWRCYAFVRQRRLREAALPTAD